MLRRVPLVLVVAGCTQTALPLQQAGTAAPDRALLYQVGLTVLMSDGTLCAGHRPRRDANWNGQLSGCPHPLPYVVRNSDPTTPRVELQRGGAAMGPTADIAGTRFSAP